MSGEENNTEVLDTEFKTLRNKTVWSLSGYTGERFDGPTCVSYWLRACPYDKLVWQIDVPPCGGILSSKLFGIFGVISFFSSNRISKIPVLLSIKNE